MWGFPEILPPMDIFESIELIKLSGIKPSVTMLDPWYNKFMTTKEEDLIYDPMCGSGTTGAFALEHNRRAILSDINEEYISIVESRLLDKRIHLNKTSPSMLTTTLQA